MAIHLLNLRAIRAAGPRDKAYWLRDGGSLFLYVTPTGSKLWRYRYRIGSVARTYAIGAYPEVSLQAAREERDKAKALVKQGMHPLTAKKLQLQAQIQKNHYTFKLLAEQWIQANPDWSATYRQQVQAYMRRDVYPALGDLPIHLIEVVHVRALLEQVARRGACAAIATRQWLSQIFNYAAQHALCEQNPATLLAGLIKRPPIRHHPPLPWPEIARFMQRLQVWDQGHELTKLGLQLVALTFVRAVELRRATWDQFDLDNKLWSIPAASMKMRRPHTVPLSKQVVALLEQIQSMTGGQGYVLPNLRDAQQPISPTAFNRAIVALGYKGQFSVHGFRSTATTLLSLLSYPENRVDLQLAHAKKDASRAPYEHTKYLSSRAMIMQDWADIWDALAQGHNLEYLTENFGPLSMRRQALLRVVERE